MLNRRYMAPRNVGPSKRNGNQWIWIVVAVVVVVVVLYACNQPG